MSFSGDLPVMPPLEPRRISGDVRDGEPSRWSSAADKRWILVRRPRAARRDEETGEQV